MTNAIATDFADRIQPVAEYDRATGLPLNKGQTNGAAQFTREAVATAGAFTAVGDAAADTSILAADATLARKGVVLYNTSTAAVKVALGFTATAANYSFRMEANEQRTITGYAGSIRAIWESDAGGFMNVTELT
jgi:hypothetical protein